MAGVIPSVLWGAMPHGRQLVTGAPDVSDDESSGGEATGLEGVHPLLHTGLEQELQSPAEAVAGREGGVVELSAAVPEL